MLVLGHRGAPREAPENTLAAFEAALRAGADGVELDVRLCASGEVVCCHDPTLRRLAGENVRIRTTPWSDLRARDLGGGARLCLLDDALDLWAARGVVNVELKRDDVDLGPLASAAVAAIERAPRCAVIVSSFDPAALDAVAKARPRLARGQLLAPMEHPDVAACLVGLDRPGLAAVHPWHGDTTPERLAAWRARGLDVNVWTVDDPGRAAELRDGGASMVITNVPAAVLPSVRVEGSDAHRHEVEARLLRR